MITYDVGLFFAARRAIFDGGKCPATVVYSS